MSDIILDSMLSGENEEVVRDNFGLGSKLLERINSKISSGDQRPYSSSDYINDEDDDETEAEKTNGNNFFSEQGENFTSANSFVKQNASQLDFADNDIKIACKVFNTYLIIEWGNNLFLIDQHAAHERLKYEKLKAEYESGNLVVQPMLVPYVISLNPEDDQIISANLNAIRSVGFDIDEFGDRTYKISSVSCQ